VDVIWKNTNYDYMDKIILTFYDTEGSLAEETVWSEKKIDDDLYIVKNTPFYAPNIAFNDIVRVEKEEGNMYFEELVKPSGNSTIQVVFFQNDRSGSILSSLEEMKCGWEGMKGEPYYAIDVPFDVSYKSIKSLLDKAFEEGVLDYKEACISAIHKI